MKDIFKIVAVPFLVAVGIFTASRFVTGMWQGAFVYEAEVTSDSVLQIIGFSGGLFLSAYLLVPLLHRRIASVVADAAGRRGEDRQRWYFLYLLLLLESLVLLAFVVVAFMGLRRQEQIPHEGEEKQS